MADNTTLNPGTGGDVIASDDIGGVKYQRVKLAVGAEGSATDATATTPLPTSVNGELLEALEAMRMAVQSLTRSMGQMLPDQQARMRVAVDAITAGLTLATVTTVGTVTTVATLSNQTNVGGYAAADQIPALMRMSAAGLRSNIQVT